MTRSTTQEKPVESVNDEKRKNHSIFALNYIEVKRVFFEIIYKRKIFNPYLNSESHSFICVVLNLIFAYF